MRCKLCSYEWESRISKPKQCPRCKSLKWNQKTKLTNCEICNVEFTKKNRLEVHHVDSDHENNYHRNLINICHKCHWYLHGGKKKLNYDKEIIHKLDTYKKIVDYFETIEMDHGVELSKEIIKKLEFFLNKYPSQRFCQILVNFVGIPDNKFFFHKKNSEILLNLILSIEFGSFKYKELSK